METFNKRGWRIAAGFIATAIATFGIGNLLGDDGGPLYGKIVAATLAVAIAGLIAAGLIVRRGNRVRGSYMIAVGVLPGALLTFMFWFPPVALTGVLSIFVAWRAFQDAVDHQQAVQSVIT